MGKIRRTNRKRTYTKKRSRKVSRKTYKQKKPRTKRIKRGRKKMLRGGSAAPAGAANAFFTFTVQNLNTELAVPIRTRPSVKVKVIKDIMADHVKFQVDQMTAEWDGTILDDDETLREVGIKEGSVMHIRGPEGLDEKEMRWSPPAVSAKRSHFQQLSEQTGQWPTSENWGKPI